MKWVSKLIWIFVCCELSISASAYSTNYSSMAVAGDFNSWNTTPNMTLVGDYTWTYSHVFTNQASLQFKFAANGDWTDQWSDTNQYINQIPLHGVAHRSDGAPVNIELSGPLDGEYTFHFNTDTLLYYVFPEGVVETFDDWAETGTSYINFTNEEWIVTTGRMSDNYDKGVGRNPNGLAITLDDAMGSSIQTPIHPLGVSQFSFWYRHWNGSTANVEYDVLVSSNGVDYSDFDTFLIPKDTNFHKYTSSQTFSNAVYLKVEHVAGSQVAVFDDFAYLSTLAEANFLDAGYSPATAYTNDSINFFAQVYTNRSASNLQVSVFYRLSALSTYSNMTMTLQGGTWWASNAIPPQTSGTEIQYYFKAEFDGAGQNSPTYYPETAPDTPAEFSIPLSPPGSAWINEINYLPTIFDSDPTNEFIELCGLAGTDLSFWTIELRDLSDVYGSYVLPEITGLRNEAEGFGFLLLGDSTVPGVSITFTNEVSSGRGLANTGYIRLLNPSGSEEFLYSYGDPEPTNLAGAIYMGADDDFVSDDISLGAYGTNSMGSGFSWTTNSIPSPGGTNENQLLINGNTNALKPLIHGPDNSTFSCTNGIPLPDISSCIATGLCGDYSAVISHVSDVSSGGTGCGDSPLYVTRTYQAVSDCATTATVEQVFTVQNTTGPSLVLSPLAPLSNTDFEDGMTNWASSGSGLVAVTNIDSYTGNYHLRLTANSATAIAYQQASAVSGQVWEASAYAAHPADVPMTGAGTGTLVLHFLNASSNVISEVRSATITSNDIPGYYHSVTARGTAPVGTAYVQLQLEMTSSSLTDAVDFDDAYLGRDILLLGTNCSATLPDYTSLATAQDECGADVTLSQQPSAGTPYASPGYYTVTIKATDACGLEASSNVYIRILDTQAPEFDNLPSTQQLVCASALPEADTNSISVSDCSEVTLTHMGDDSTGSGCGGDIMTVTRTWRAVDAYNQTNTSVQVFLINDEEAPQLSIDSGQQLTNASFETGTFSDWGTFGAAQILTTNPYSGTYHAALSGQDTGSQNYNGIYQDARAVPGQPWRGAAMVYIPESLALGASNTCYIKLQFLDSNESFISEAVGYNILDADTPTEAWMPLAVSTTAPSGTAKARLLVERLQSGAEGGTVYIDATRLAPMEFSADALCGAILPDLDPVVDSMDECGLASTSQDPVALDTILLGTNTVTYEATDDCGLSATTTVFALVYDDTAPEITGGPADVFVTSTNDVPAIDTNSITAHDTCLDMVYSHVRDTDNGADGTLGNPLIITRVYRVTDAAGNPADYLQTITVEASAGAAPDPAVISQLQMGTNLHVISIGSNTWSFTAEYTTNLSGSPVEWMAVSNQSSSWNGSTNTTWFDWPTGVDQATIRMRQHSE